MKLAKERGWRIKKFTNRSPEHVFTGQNVTDETFLVEYLASVIEIYFSMDSISL